MKKLFFSLLASAALGLSAENLLPAKMDWNT